MTPELVRLSVGIEDVRDIIADLAQAIEAANGTTHTQPAPAGHGNRKIAMAANHVYSTGDLVHPAQLHLTQGTVSVTRQGPFELDCGRKLEAVNLRYAMYGEPNAECSNVTLVCHALSGSARVDQWWPDRAGRNLRPGAGVRGVFQRHRLLLRLDQRGLARSRRPASLMAGAFRR